MLLPAGGRAALRRAAAGDWVEGPAGDGEGASLCSAVGEETDRMVLVVLPVTVPSEVVGRVCRIEDVIARAVRCVEGSGSEPASYGGGGVEGYGGPWGSAAEPCWGHPGEGWSRAQESAESDRRGSDSSLGARLRLESNRSKPSSRPGMGLPGSVTGTPLIGDAWTPEGIECEEAAEGASE
mmetsp:Transcript_5354/g.13706  ORF Transcript_5354/g.13706 Transcript_5354/m.13706 type:complete len:181 (-) Transcript_5354:503-1045(-)